jgi:hypothetical protein
MLFSAQSGDHLTMRPTGFDPSCPVVVLGSGAKIPVRKQIAGDADLVGRGNRARPTGGVVAP